jgi:Ion channel
MCRSAGLVLLACAAATRTAALVLPGTRVPGSVLVCVTPYAPFVYPTVVDTPSTPGSPLHPYASLNTLLEPDTVFVTPLSPPSGLLTGFNLTGFDVAMARLVLERSLDQNVSFLLKATFLEMYLALRSGECDVAITATELDQQRSSCLASCTPVPAGGFESMLVGADYADNWTPELLAADCCMMHGVPYITAGFALASKMKKNAGNIQLSLTNTALLNCGLFLLAMMLCFGFVAALFENSSGLPTFGAGVYWSLTTISTVGYGDETPKTTWGRTMASIWMVLAIVGMAVFNALLSSSLTSALLQDGTFIQNLNQISGTLCVQSEYPLLAQWVRESDTKPTSIVFNSIEACMTMLETGTVGASPRSFRVLAPNREHSDAGTTEAVISDRPVLAFYVQQGYAFPGATVRTAFERQSWLML